MAEHPESKSVRKDSTAQFRALVLAGLAIFGVAALAPLAFGAHAWMAAARWIGIAVLATAGIRKPTLTYWIFFSMLAGFNRKSTRLNSSHPSISYAVFCLKKKTLSLHDALPI